MALRSPTLTDAFNINGAAPAAPRLGRAGRPGSHLPHRVRATCAWTEPTLLREPEMHACGTCSPPRAGAAQRHTRPPPTASGMHAGGLIAVKTLSRFQERACSSTTSCDSAIVSALMVVVTACGAFVITHGATFLPDTRPRAEAVAMHIAEALSSGNTAATQTSVYRPPTGGQFRWPHFLHLYRTRDKNALRIGYNTILWIPALLWAAVAFGTTFIVTPAEVEFRLASPVYLAVTNAAEWGAVRFDGCNDVMWRVDDGVSPVMLRRTIRRCYDARRLASNELPRSQLPAAGPTASLLITSDFVRVAVLYENGAISTISRVSSRVVDLADRQPAAASPLRGGAGGGRTDISGMFLTSRIRLEALIPYFEAAMAQPEYEECGPPRFQFLEDDGSTFSGRWVFTCTPARGAELGVDGLLLAVFLRHTEYRFDSQRSGEEFEVFVPVRGLEGAPGEVIEVMGWGNGMLIGNVTVIWCNWLCSVIVAAVAVALAAITAAATAGLAKNLPTF